MSDILGSIVHMDECMGDRQLGRSILHKTLDANVGL